MGVYFKCGGNEHIANQCPSRQANTVLHDDLTSYENPIDKKVEVEARDPETRLPEVISEPDPKIHMLFIQMILKEDKKG